MVLQAAVPRVGVDRTVVEIHADVADPEVHETVSPAAKQETARNVRGDRAVPTRNESSLKILVKKS